MLYLWLTFFDKIVILLKSLLMETLYIHMYRSILIPLGHHYCVCDHRIVLMFYAEIRQRWRHFIFWWTLRTISLIITLINHLHSLVWSYYLVDWLKFHLFRIGWKKDEAERKLKIQSTWKWVRKIEEKKLIYLVHARNNFLHDNIIKQIVRKMLENKKKREEK